MSIKNIDKTTFILLLFLLFAAILFSYIFKIERNMNSYTKESAKLVQLQLLEKELDNFSLAINKFTNYDTIDAKEKEFQKRFHNIQKALHKSSIEDPRIKKLLQKIKESFQTKVADLEYFKAQNSSLINTSHFLFDLQATIAKSKDIPLLTKYYINELLFYLLKYSSSNYIDKETLLNILQNLQKQTKKVQNDYLENFYLQAKQMLNILSELKVTSKAILSNSLSNDIENLAAVLNQNYNKNIYKQTLIASLFFIFTIVLLLLFLYAHLKSLQTQQELFAFRYAIENSDNIVVMTDTQRNITYVNETFENTTGYKQAEVLGKNPNILKSGIQSKTFYKELNHKLSEGKKWEGQFINKRKDGSLVYEKASIVPIYLKAKLIGYLAIKLDITEYIEQNQKLAQAASVFENTEEAIIIADKEQKISSVNSAFTKIYGYTNADVSGKSLRLLHSNEQKKEFYKDMWEQINTKGIWRGKIINKTKDGLIIPVWSTIKKVLNEKGELLNYTAIQTDLREIESSRAKADYLAYHDPLTGFYNRVNFEEYLLHSLSIAKRSNAIVALLFIDLDRFKVINDTLGHDIGDKVLIEVSKKLKNILRESDFIARWGGDEFVVILEDIGSVSDAALVANNIIDALQAPMHINKHKLLTTASIGIAIFPENGTDAQTLIKHADSAMYLAKDDGKNCYRYYTQDLSEEIQRKLNIDMALHTAIANNEMYMVFQPQYSLKSKEIVSAEALIRWENKKLGSIPPDQFIPIAEDNGMIIQIGYFVFEESCKALKKMFDAGVRLSYIAINVSSIQFKEPHVLDTFMAIAKRHGILPSNIEIEITERFTMEQTDENIKLLKEFQERGFKISIDDFGTGYSSMSYLKKLPIDTIKIDKSFIDDINSEHSDNIIIEAIVALAKTLGYNIVAEGIEREEQELFLQQIRCDLGQGYLFSKPIKVDEIIKKYAI
jgi:diguanylate cyclase (GGDEF)-like protein/PAS domain S-box-containing protein